MEGRHTHKMDDGWMEVITKITVEIWLAPGWYFAAVVVVVVERKYEGTMMVSK